MWRDLVGTAARAPLALLALAACAAAQTSGGPAPSPDSLGCGRQAALFSAERGFKAWITRSGSMQQGDPLRPLDALSMKVLEAHIGAKVATAYGPDFASLRRGLAPADLQAGSGGATIHWEPSVDALPRELRIVAEDGARIADLSFENCGEAPKVAPAKAAARPAKAAGRPADPPAAARKPTARPAERTPPGLSLPQGAIE